MSLDSYEIMGGKNRDYQPYLKASLYCFIQLVNRDPYSRFSDIQLVGYGSWKIGLCLMPKKICHPIYNPTNQAFDHYSALKWRRFIALPRGKKETPGRPPPHQRNQVTCMKLIKWN